LALFADYAPVKTPTLRDTSASYCIETAGSAVLIRSSVDVDDVYATPSDIISRCPSY